MFTISQSMLRLFQLKNKEVIAVGNAIAQVFIQGYPKIFHSDHGREFAKRILDVYLVRINLKHILG